jgi:hypothetical protein
MKVIESKCEECKYSDISQWTGAATFTDIFCTKKKEYIIRGAFIYRLILKCVLFEKVIK